MAGDSFAKNITWATPGEKQVMVMATNAAGTVISSVAISIVVPPPPLVAPTAVQIAGPSIAYVNSPQTFEATVQPLDSTQPITYVWQATDLPGVETYAGLTSTITLAWTTPGIKTVAVTASNQAGSVAATQEVTISVPPPPPVAVSAVLVDGPRSGNTGISYTITAAANPVTATTPITYEWQATDQAIRVQVNGATDSAAFTWDLAGEKQVIVTARNSAGSATGVSIITITVPPPPVVAPGAVQIAGAPNGEVNIPLSFTATVDPTNATQPITYTWEGTDLQPLTVVGGGSGGVILTWSIPGVKQVRVTAQNAGGAVSTAIEVIIAQPAPQIVAPTGVTISGRGSGVPGQALQFTAVTDPISVTAPLTYVWEATGLPGQVQIGGASSAVAFTWTNEGVKWITVTVGNTAGSVAASATVNIAVAPPAVVPISGLTINGPTQGTVRKPYTFSLAATPGEATQPVTYTWQVTDQATYTNVTGLGDSVTFTWSRAGEKVIKVRAENTAGSIAAEHRITIGSFALSDCGVNKASATPKNLAQMGIAEVVDCSVPGQLFSSKLNKIKAIVVGTRTDGLPGAWEVSVTGSLQQLRALKDKGIGKPLPDGCNLLDHRWCRQDGWVWRVTGISDDGRVISGVGTAPNGTNYQAKPGPFGPVRDAAPGTQIGSYWGLGLPLSGRIGAVSFAYPTASRPWTPLGGQWLPHKDSLYLPRLVGITGGLMTTLDVIARTSCRYAALGTDISGQRSTFCVLALEATGAEGSGDLATEQIGERAHYNPLVDDESLTEDPPWPGDDSRIYLPVMAR